MKQSVFAHRGASGYAPENTMEAFELALRQGADGIELDVHLSRDGELVVAHDEEIDRVADGSGLICEMTLKELKGYRFNRVNRAYPDARIPTLREVYELIRPTAMRINCELKNSYIDYPGLEEKCIALADELGLKDRVLYSSFNHHSLIRVKQMDPSLYCGMLYEASLIKPWNYARMYQMDALHPHFSELQIPGEAENAHRLGLELNVWTVNTARDLKACFEAGADSVITNYPDVALRVRNG